MENLKNKTIAILTENGFEEVELTSPKKALEDAGATVHVISPQKEKVRAMKDHEWSIEVKVDKHLSDANSSDYDGLVLPGGVINPDQLRQNNEAIGFVTAFFDEGKPVGAICHGSQTLIEAGIVDGRELTSYPSIRTDLENAGAIWVNKEVVVDNGLVTSRTPADLPAFNKRLIEEISEGIHQY